MKIIKEKGEEILLGNEAVTRGAIESQVQFASTYPGTPASEIGDTFNKIKKQDKLKNLYFEYSTNEKNALEAAIGANYAGLVSFVAMKHFGLNVCADSLMPFLYTGSKAPFVIAVADDPSCHSSGQSEQNSRWFGKLAHIPILEPSNPKEAKEFTKKAFKISEKFQLPIMVRLTTRVSHQRQPIKLEDYEIPEPDADFEKDPKKFITMPPRVLEMKEELLEKNKKLQEEIDTFDLNKENGNQDRGIITSSVAYLHTKEALKEIDSEFSILKLGIIQPLPEKKIISFLKDLEEVFIIEELEPYLENQVKRICKKQDIDIKIKGKKILTQAKKKFNKNLSSHSEELRSEYIKEALLKIADEKSKLKFKETKEVEHIPRFCSQCPYWRLFASIKTSIQEESIGKENIVFGGDIGCYMMSGLPHTNLQDYLLNMGSSVGIGHGVKKALELSKNDQKAIAFIGDSTFFHSGMTALLNATYNQSNLLVIIFDNRITAMTGQQPNPGMGKTGMGKKSVKIDIEEIVKSFGVNNVKTLDPVQDFEDMKKTFKDYLDKSGVSVIISKHICYLREKAIKNEE